MSALPILVEWGNVLSKVIVAGAAGLALLGFRAVRNRRDVGPARADAHRMSLSIDEPREGPIAVRGTYRGGSLDCSGQKVDLAGDVKIVRGSAATWKSGKRTYTIRDGDVVVAIGRMEHRANADADGGYRDAAGGWRLMPSAGEPAIEMCIVKPVACPKPLWPIRGVIVLAITGVVAFYGLGYLGGKLVDRRTYPRGPWIEGDGASTVASQIACALPRNRNRALNRYGIDLAYKPQTSEVVEAFIAVEKLRYCEGAADILYDRARYEEAIETARECGHDEYARASLLALGKYDEAAAITKEIAGPFGDNPLRAMIGAGRWSEAAKYVANRSHRDARGDRCFVRFLKLHADPNQIVDEEEVESTNVTCRLTYRMYGDADDVKLGIARWAFADGPFESVDIGFAAWLAPFVEQESPRVHELRAGLAMDLGHFDVAAAELERVRELVGPAPDDANEKRLQAIVSRRAPNLLALRTGKPIAAFELDDEYNSDEDEAALLRAGGDPAKLPKLSMRDPRLTEAVAAAAAGDGLPLADLLERYTDHDQLPLATIYLLAVAPKVTKHRAELARAFRNRMRFGGDHVLYLVHELAIARDLYRMLGDNAAADRLQAIIDRHAKALADPAKLEALLIDS